MVMPSWEWWTWYRISGYLRVMFFPRFIPQNRVLNVRSEFFKKSQWELRSILFAILCLYAVVFFTIDNLANIAENRCTWKKPDIRYDNSINLVWQSFNWSIYGLGHHFVVAFRHEGTVHLLRFSEYDRTASWYFIYPPWVYCKKIPVLRQL